MTPDELSRRLRLLADGIDESGRPSVAAVAAEMKRLLLQVKDAAMPARIPGGGGRRLSPAIASPVDVMDRKAFKDAMGRVASGTDPSARVLDYSR
jgi:hypothetical protein